MMVELLLREVDEEEGNVKLRRGEALIARKCHARGSLTNQWEGPMR